MSKAVVLHATGGPEALSWEEFDPGAPGAGQALVAHGAVGVNFIDIYQRTGLYSLPSLPAVLGLEGAGVVEAVGEGVTDVAVGDRVAYAGGPPGAYAEKRVIPAHRLVRMPDSLSFHDVAGVMLRGMTARYLLKGCYQAGPGSTILVHAASGGVGTLLTQWARHLGVRVIGTVGSAEKAVQARKNGCEHVILYREEDFVAKVREFTGGKGVDAVYDSVGQATFLKSLDCLRPMGILVSFGQSSGNVEPFSPGLLAAKGSLFLTRPSLMDYTREREDLLAHARDLFEVLESGAVQAVINQEYPLREVGRAHADLEARRTSGCTVLRV
ncbi:MAG: quinone oxidoreductase [Desulfovibrio sp.]